MSSRIKTVAEIRSQSQGSVRKVILGSRSLARVLRRTRSANQRSTIYDIWDSDEMEECGVAMRSGPDCRGTPSEDGEVDQVRLTGAINQSSIQQTHIPSLGNVF